jgi:hypothetical protein
MTQDIHRQAIPAKELEQIQAKAKEISALLAPYIIALTPEERRDLPKTGEKTFAFTEKAYQIYKEYPALRPNFIDEAAYTADYEDAMRLRIPVLAFKQLSRALDDLQMIAGSEAFQSGLDVYRNIQAQARRNIGNAKVLYDELSKRFPRGRRGKQDDESGADE